MSQIVEPKLKTESEIKAMSKKELTNYIISLSKYLKKVNSAKSDKKIIQLLFK